MAQRLTEIAKQMQDVAKEKSFTDDYTPFERELGHGLRLRCYLFAGNLTLDIERRYRELEHGEVHIVRAAFHATSRDCKTQSIESGEGWHGVRVTMELAPVQVETEPGLQQAPLF